MIGRGEQPPIPNYLSKEAQDFIGQCVRVDPENRPSASQLLGHPLVVLMGGACLCEANA
jgi:mitogen-activated protein kinase kinase kinase 1